MSEVTNEDFKNMVYNHIADIMPIYILFQMFDSGFYKAFLY